MGVLCRGAGGRGGHRRRVPFDEVLGHFSRQSLDVQATREALGGFNAPEVTEQLGMPAAEVEAADRLARARLRMRPKEAPP